MNSFLLDASALVKRYAPEAGSPLLHHLFTRATSDRLMSLMLGAAEVAAALVRKRNIGAITSVFFAAAMAQLRIEVLAAADFTKLPADNSLINASIALLNKHALNATDGIVLQSALAMAALLRADGHDLVLLTADQRLLRAAQAEGLVTFDPENDDQSTLDTLLGP